MKENKMGVMPIGKLIITMSLPIMISMLVQALYNVVDSIFVARVSENALTAVSMAFPIQSLMIAVGMCTRTVEMMKFPGKSMNFRGWSRRGDTRIDLQREVIRVTPAAVLKFRIFNVIDDFLQKPVLQLCAGKLRIGIVDRLQRRKQVLHCFVAFCLGLQFSLQILQSGSQLRLPFLHDSRSLEKSHLIIDPFF